MPTINPEFIKFLEQFPEAFGKFVSIAEEWYKLQGEIPETNDADGPEKFVIGGKVELKTKGISNEELDAITKGYAEAVVKEKAIQYVKGFVAGVMLI